MDNNNNNNHNLIIISENQDMRINIEINSSQREYYKMLFSTILYLFVIPLILFLITQKNQNIFLPKIENNYQIDSNNINIYKENNINEQKRKLDGENINIKFGKQLSSKSNSSSLEEEITKYLDMILERFGKNIDYLNNLFQNSTQSYSKEQIYAQKERELFVQNLIGHGFKGTWEYYPYNPYEAKDEKNFENFYKENFSEINRLP